MEFVFYDKAFNPIGVTDEYLSMLWVEKFIGAGKMEFEIPATSKHVKYAADAAWIGHRESSNLMRAHYKTRKFDVDNGNVITITGPSLEHVLNHRVLLTIHRFKMPLENSIRAILDINFVNPSDKNRLMTEMSPRRTFTSSRAKTYTVNASRKYVSAYDVIMEFCQAANVGVKIGFAESVVGKFDFDLYDGRDLTGVDQYGNYVEFSPRMENIDKTEYLWSDAYRINAPFVYSKYGDNDITMYSGTGEIGLNRIEMAFDGSSIPTKNADNTELTYNEYHNELYQYGLSEYWKRYTYEEFSSEINPYQSYRIGKDFFLGDTVKISDGLGYEEKSRVVEVAYYWGSDKETVVPTFAKDRAQTIDPT